MQNPRPETAIPFLTSYLVISVGVSQVWSEGIFSPPYSKIKYKNHYLKRI